MATSIFASHYHMTPEEELLYRRWLNEQYEAANRLEDPLAREQALKNIQATSANTVAQFRSTQTAQAPTETSGGMISSSAISQAPPGGGQSAFYQQELSKEMGRLKELPELASKGAEADARRAGTYADTPEFKAGLQGESMARHRGLKGEQLTRINAIRKKLNMPDYTE